MEDNKKLYASPKIVEEYNHSTVLTCPEKTILEMIRSGAANGKMLDMGVGTGRTTRFFAPLFKSYTGLDYSPAMIDSCRKQFGNMDVAKFIVGDARDMHMLANHDFDFVLFSFNGIDCVPLHDRQQILKEIVRVCKPGGKFAFSSHNIFNVPRLYSFQIPRNPVKYIAEYKRMKKVRAMNPPAGEVLKNRVVELFDGDMNFTARYIYINPEAQLSQLKEHGFSGIRIFSLLNGKELPLNSNWAKVTDAWLYYLCTL